MGYLDSLAKVQERLAQKSGGDFEDRVKATWLTVKPNSSVKITPLQELDEGSPNYNTKLGVARFVLMHSNPDNWQKKAPCTADEGECFGCSKGWYQSVVLYINVLVDDGENDPYVALWGRGVGKNSVAKQLLEIASDEDFGNSITDKSFKLTRSGSGNDSSYTLVQLPKPLVKKVDAYADDIFDIDKSLFKVTPERQEAYYLDGAVDTEKAKEPVSASSVNSEW